jgi:hypothetical protein
MAGSLESRISNLEELIIIIILNGGGIPGLPHKGDPPAPDTTRLDAMSRLFRRIPVPDPFASDITRLSAEAVESSLLEVNAELTRLRSVEGQLNARLKELRATPGKG